MNAFPLLGGRWGWGGWNRRQRKPAPDEAPPGSTRARRHADIGGQGVSAFPGAYRWSGSMRPSTPSALGRPLRPTVRDRARPLPLGMKRQTCRATIPVGDSLLRLAW